jgi:lipopolysaccharide export LptBFGC system permease protein LptF
VHRLPHRQLVAARAAGISTILKTLSLLAALIALVTTLLSPGVH